MPSSSIGCSQLPIQTLPLLLTSLSAMTLAAFLILPLFSIASCHLLKLGNSSHTIGPPSQCVIDRTVPDHECEIRVRALLADEPSPISEDTVQHPYRTFYLVPIAGLSRRQLLRVGL